MSKKVLVAMSGGVDSSVSAYLLKEQGYDCAGAMMRLYESVNAGGGPVNGCSSPEDEADARTVASRMGIPFHLFDFTACFAEEVIERFVEAYRQGVTPNPCIECNRRMKFGRFFKMACEIGADYIATGHYARIEYDAPGGRYLLKKAANHSKDQSYVLYGMAQEQLARTLFPLGGLEKSAVREIAREQGFINAKKRDSQDICFVRDGDYAKFIEEYAGISFEKGRFVDTSGNDLGEHKGIIHYTVGQRKGLGISSPAPLYVCAIRPESGTVVLGGGEELYAKTLTAGNINLTALDRIDAPMRVHAKIRYRQQEQPATVVQLDSDTLRIDFDNPQRAITKGQSVVLYDGEFVIGGGTII